jgi:5'-deoxynucleotidase
MENQHIPENKKNTDKNHFLAFILRMRYINRWSLMRNTLNENIAEHSLQVAIIANLLANIKNTLFSGNVNADKIAVIAMYHDANETITGDLPTPIKYFNPEIKKAYKGLESESISVSSVQRILSLSASGVFSFPNARMIATCGRDAGILGP